MNDIASALVLKKDRTQRRSRPGNGKTPVTFSSPSAEPGGVVSTGRRFDKWRPDRHLLARPNGTSRSVTVDLDSGHPPIPLPRRRRLVR